MAKKKGDLIVSEIVDVANRTYEYMFAQLSRSGYINTGNMASVVAVLFRISFAFDERNNGIDAARRTFDSAFNFMSNTMIEGAWDEENKCIK